MRRMILACGVVVLVIALVLGFRHGKRHATNETGSATETATIAGARDHARVDRAPKMPASVSGTVRRKADGAGLPGTVSLAKSELAIPGLTSATEIVVATDGGGVWTAERVEPGSYVVTAGAPGFLPATLSKLIVISGQDEHGVDLALVPGGTELHGTVSDVGGGPVGGARVSASTDVFFKSGAEVATLTDAEGNYRLSLGDGSFELAARHDDYTVVTRSIEVSGKPLVENFVLIPGGSIRGEVIARDTGKPLAAASVLATHGRMQGGGEPIAADSDGKFVLHSLMSGAISITASGPGYASATPTVVELGIGEQVAGVRVLVDRAYSISGRVVTPGKSNEGIPGVKVGGFSLSTTEAVTAPDPTDAEGAFEIVGVRPGSYMLFALGDDKVPAVGQSIPVVDKDVTGVTIEMAKGVTLSGHVQPAAAASITIELAAEVSIGNLFDAMKTMLVRADTDDAGAFALHNVAPGKFYILATTYGGTSGKLPITVGASDQADLVVALEPRASIAGRVIDTNGAMVAGSKVRATPTEDRPQMMTTDDLRETARSAADGTFRIVGLEAGKYRVDVEDLEDHMSGDEHEKAQAVDVELSAGAQRSGVVLKVEAKDGVIRGQAMSGEQKPAPDTWVTAHRETAHSGQAEDFDEGATGRAPVLTGPDGKFVINHLSRATYTLVAEGPRGTSRAAKNGVKTGESVTITLASLGTLTVSVPSVPSYELSCTSPAAAIQRSVAAIDGAVTLEHLAPGHYECGVSAASGAAKGAVDVPTGPARLELALVPWASISGIVVSVVSGQPVPDIIAVTSGDEGRGFADVMAGVLLATDATGHFALPKVSAGSGNVELFPRSSSFQLLGSREYTVTQGQRLDLGTIKIVPPRTGEAGTLGMAVSSHDAALVIGSVNPGGPADQAGIKPGDKIVTIEGNAVATIGLELAMQFLASGNVCAGQVVTIGLERGPAITLTAIKW